PNPGTDPITDLPPADLMYPNLPADMTLIGYNDGSVKTAGGSAFGIPAFGNWSSGEQNVSVVSDPNNPTGSGQALQLLWNADDCCAATASWEPVSELYVMLRYV